MVDERDRTAGLFLLAIPAALAAAVFFCGRTVYWGDLAYIHHPWRVLAAEYVQRGMLPLWNPYAYLGMPLAAELQCAAWYPGTILFYLFPFEGATALFYALHFGLAGVFGFLWLRDLRMRRTAALAGAAVFMGCGSMASRLPFLNHLSSLAYLPAFFLLLRRPWLLGPALALCFLSGYPTILIGGAAAAFALPLLLRSCGPREALSSVGEWLAAGAFAAGAAACLLLPAARLLATTHRGAGLGLEETLRFGFSPSDLLQWISPLLIRPGDFSATTLWWKDCYVGFAAALAVGAAVFRLRRRALMVLGGALAAVFLLQLGGSTAPSLWLWSHWAPLRYIRYPGNLAFLALPVVSLLAACGLHGRRWSAAAAAAVLVELTGYAVAYGRTTPRGIFTDAGPLVRQLQAELEGHRYLLSGLALQTHAGAGPTPEAGTLDWKHRLYGLTNVPFHLSAAGNFGEPLVPAGSYAFMDFLYRRPGLDAAAPYLPWADIRVVLTRDRKPSEALEFRRKNLWYEYWERPAGFRTAAPAGDKRQGSHSVPPASEGGRAYWFDSSTGAALPVIPDENAPPPNVRRGRPLEFAADREDHFRVRGEVEAGWVYLAQPRVDGWRCLLDGKAAAAEPALGAFEKFKVDAGELDLRCRYDPASWRAGLVATLAVLWGAAAYWYNRALAARPRRG